MYLLKFFLEWGKNGLGALWILYFGLAAWFIYQTITALRSGWRKDTLAGTTQGEKSVPIWRIGAFRFLIAITVIAIVIHLVIQSSYKGS